MPPLSQASACERNEKSGGSKKRAEIPCCREFSQLARVFFTRAKKNAEIEDSRAVGSFLPTIKQNKSYDLSESNFRQRSCLS